MSERQYELCSDERGQMGPTPILPMFLTITLIVAIIITDGFASEFGYSNSEMAVIAFAVWLGSIAGYSALMVGLKRVHQRVKTS